MKSRQWYNKNTEAARNSWKDFPDVLADLIRMIDRSDGEYCVRDAIRFLNNHDAGYNNRDGNAKLTYLKWIDGFFRVLNPAFSFDSSWKEFSDDLEMLLNKGEQYLCDLAGDYEMIKASCRTESGYCNGEDLVCITQNMDIYFCALYWNQGSEELFREKLSSILEATKRNVRYMLSNEFAAEFLEFDLDGMDGQDSMSSYYWQMIMRVYHAGGSSSFPETMINIYEEYINFLSGLDDSVDIRTRNKLLFQAENDLQLLYRFDFEKRQDEGEIPGQYYGSYYDEYERKIQESMERLEAISARDTENCVPRIIEDECKDDESVLVHAWNEAKIMLEDKETKLSYKTWIEPLSLYHVDRRNNIVYLRWPNHENLVRYLEETYLEQIEKEVRKNASELDKVVILAVDDTLQNQYYHQKWHDFTMNLRDLMEDSTVPVVIFRESDAGESEAYIADPELTECIEGYAYDPDSDKFTEKIIAVYAKKSRNSSNLFFGSDEEMPF